MKRSRSLLATLSYAGVLIATASAPAWAVTPPVLTIADSLGDSVTIDSTGTVTFGGGCTASSCSTSGLTISPGIINWTGVLNSPGPNAGLFFENIQGTSKPALASPQMSLGGRAENITGAPVTVTIQWSDTGFSPGESPATITAAVGTAPLNSGLNGPGTITNVSFSAYVDSTNTLNGTQTPVGTLSFNNVIKTTQSGSATGSGPATDPFSMTEVETFTMSGSAPASVNLSYFFNNFTLMVAPYPPLALACPAASGQAGFPYTAFLSASGGNPPYTYSIIQGSLPPNLMLDASSGAITGIPLSAGLNPFTAQVVDSSGTTANTVSTSCSITISSGPPVGKGDTATIGFWHNKNGQALINALNGGSSSTNLANWLATQFPYLYGVSSPNDLTNKTNVDVAALFLTFFGVTGQKTNAQILSAALASYVTDTALAGTVAAGYGFNTSSTGTGGKTYNVGSLGTAIGLSNNTSYTVLQLLIQANLDMQNGTFDANAFNTIFSNINQGGDIS